MHQHPTLSAGTGRLVHCAPNALPSAPKRVSGDQVSGAVGVSWSEEGEGGGPGGRVRDAGEEEEIGVPAGPPAEGVVMITGLALPTVAISSEQAELMGALSASPL